MWLFRDETMLTKRSRYYKLDDTVHPDRSGILRSTKVLRPTQDVDGQFFHTVESSDRLDHLAYKYYRQSLHWWRICDANPDVMPPRELLGKTPQETLAMDVQWKGGAPPWNQLFETVHTLAGVEKLTKGDSAAPEPVVLIDEDSSLFTLDESLRTALDEAVLTQQFPAALDAALQAQGLTLTGSLRFSKPGEQRWLIGAGAAGTHYVFSYSSSTDVVTVYDTVMTSDWLLTVVYNTNTMAQQELTDAILALGFSVTNLQVLTRIGQPIVIPPRYTGKS